MTGSAKASHGDEGGGGLQEGAARYGCWLHRCDHGVRFESDRKAGNQPKCRKSALAKRTLLTTFVVPAPGTSLARPKKFRIMATANDLRRGMAINYNGDIAVVLDSQHRTPGNLRAFVQATIRSIRTGKSSDVRFSSTEKIEVVPMMTRKMEFSYKDGEILFSPIRKPTKPSRISAGNRRRREELPGGKRAGHHDLRRRQSRFD